MLRDLERRSALLQKAILRNIAQTEQWKQAFEELQDTTSFRVGRRIMAVKDKPLSLFSLPWDLVKIMRTRGVRSPSPESIVAFEEALDHYLTHNIDDTVDYVTGRLVRHEAAQRYEALAALAGKFSEAGFEAAQYEFLKAAERTQSTGFSTNAVYLAARREGDIETACAMIAAHEAHLGDDVDERSELRLKRMKSDVVHQLAARQHVPARRQRDGEAVRNRVCYVLHNSAPHASGGYATRAQGLARALTNQGLEVIGVTRPGFPVDLPNADEALPATEDTVDGIRYLRAFEPRRRTIPFRDYVPEAAAVMEQQFRELAPEFVVAASNYIVALPALIAARRLGMPFLYEVRGFWEITRASREPGYPATNGYRVQSAMETFVGREADQVATLTQAMAEEMIARGVPEAKISLLPNACNPAHFERDHALQATARAQLGLAAEICVIGYVGTFVDYEGLPDLVDAAGMLKARGLEFRLLIVGNDNTADNLPGPIAGEIRQRAQAHGLTDWLLMPGRVPHEEVALFYAAIDIAAFPRKPWPVCEMVSPMKPLEAMCAEKAVVVSSVRALQEMVSHGETGLIYTKNDTSELADVLGRLIANPQERERLGANARRWVHAERTWEIVAGRGRALLERLRGT